MIIDGRAMAKQHVALLQNAVSHLPHTPHVTVVTCAPSFATNKYIGLKKQVAGSAGIAVSIVELPEDITTEEAIHAVERLALQTDGLIVQLPLPAHVDTEAVVRAIPSSVDVDGLNYAVTQETFLPPVVAAIKEIAAETGVVWVDRTVVVLGEGRLVGAPVTTWAAKQGAKVNVVTETTADPASVLLTADIIISGVGKPGLVTPEQVREGVVVFDAGTAEDAGELRGDVVAAVAEKASVFTPVPGGIGPLTVVMLLRNVVAACR